MFENRENGMGIEKLSANEIKIKLRQVKNPVSQLC